MIYYKLYWATGGLGGSAPSICSTSRQRGGFGADS